MFNNLLKKPNAAAICDVLDTKLLTKKDIWHMASHIDACFFDDFPVILRLCDKSHFYLENLKALEKSGVDFSVKNAYQQTLAHLWARKFHYEMDDQERKSLYQGIGKLFDMGCPIFEKDIYGMKALDYLNLQPGMSCWGPSVHEHSAFYEEVGMPPKPEKVSGYFKEKLNRPYGRKGLNVTTIFAGSDYSGIQN